MCPPLTSCSRCDMMNVVLLVWEGHELCVACFRERFPVEYQSLLHWMRRHLSTAP